MSMQRLRAGIVMLPLFLFAQCSGDSGGQPDARTTTDKSVEPGSPNGTESPSKESATENPNPSSAQPSSAQPSAPAPEDPQPEFESVDLPGLPQPLVFDREARLAFAARPDDPVFNFYSTGTVDLMFCPSRQPTQDTEDGLLQCLLACSDAPEQTRYAFYLLEDLQGIGYWNGERWWRIEFALVPDRWVHLTAVFQRGWLTVSIDGMPVAVLRAPIGRPIDPADASGRKLAFCSTHLGTAANGSDAFVGRIAWVRTWRAPLRVDDVSGLPTMLGAPEDPVLAQCLAATSDFSATPRMQTSSIALRAGQAEQARAAKLERAFYKAEGAFEWSFDLAAAKKTAAAEDAMFLFAYATRGDAYDPRCLQVEAQCLSDPELLKQIAKTTEQNGRVLLVGSTKDRAPSGVPAGCGALFFPASNKPRIFEVFDAEFLDGLMDYWEDFPDAGPDQRAFALLWHRSAHLSADELAELARLANRADVSETNKIRIGHIQQVQRMLELQRRFQRGEPLAEQGGAPVPFEQAMPVYAREALRLFADADLPVEPQAVLSDLAILLWKALVDEGREDLLGDIANFVTPMRHLSATVDAFVVANPLPPIDPEEGNSEEGESGR